MNACVIHLQLLHVASYIASQLLHVCKCYICFVTDAWVMQILTKLQLEYICTHACMQVVRKLKETWLAIIASYILKKILNAYSLMHAGPGGYWQYMHVLFQVSSLGFVEESQSYSVIVDRMGMLYAVAPHALIHSVLAYS